LPSTFLGISFFAFHPSKLTSKKHSKFAELSKFSFVGLTRKLEVSENVKAQTREVIQKHIFELNYIRQRNNDFYYSFSIA
jgi:hypothetical protein